MNIKTSNPNSPTLQVRPKPQPEPKASSQAPSTPENKDVFYSSLSEALELTVPGYSAGIGILVGGGLGVTAGTMVGLAFNALTGTNTIVPPLAGLAVGLTMGVRTGYTIGSDLGEAIIQGAGQFGESHNTENPAKGRAIAQALTGTAVTLLTLNPQGTALIVGGSAAYATCKSIQASKS